MRFVITWIGCLLAVGAAADNGDLKHPDWHPDGNILIAEGSCHGNIGLYTIEVAAATVRLAYDSEHVDGYPRWFADGHRIVFHQIDKNRSSRVFVANVSATGDVMDVGPVTPGPFDIEPAPSPDGTRIAFSAAGEAGQDIAILNLKTGIVQVWQTPEAENFPSWHPDRGSIIFHARASRETHIFRRFLLTNEVRKVTLAGSPNIVGHVDNSGSRLVFSSERDQDREIYIKDLASGNEMRFTVRPGRDGYPKFSPDGRRIAHHQEDKDGRVMVRIVELQSGESEVISCPGRPGATRTRIGSLD